MVTYNLSICSVNNIDIYGLISNNKKILKDYLTKYDHEGSGLSLVRQNEDSSFTNIEEVEEIYKELEE